MRLTALRAFLKFASRRDVSSFHVIERALGVPMKRFERPMLGFLSREEMRAVMGEPGNTWISQRDHLLFAMLYNTGARVSEIIGVRVADVVIDGPACVHLRGKGRKQRSVPLWKTTVQEIRAWLHRNPMLSGGAALLPNRDGQAMTPTSTSVWTSPWPGQPRCTAVWPNGAYRRTRFGTRLQCICCSQAWPSA
jgi:site-specific recombinase XerD